MRFGTSFFDWTVFKKTIARFWPLWGAYFAIWLVMLPLNGMMLLRRTAEWGDGHNYVEDFAMSYVLGSASRGSVCVVLTAAFGVLAAMAVFSHLYNARSANLFGSLPVRREGLFVTHYLAGLAFLIVPNAAIFLLCLLVEALGGCVYLPGLLFWLGITCGECFLFYSMAVFCAMFTGHILALPAFYAILNGIVAGVAMLLQVVLQGFYYGFSGFTEEVYCVLKWFTPMVQLVEKVESNCYNTADTNAAASNWVVQMGGLGTVGVYAIVAAALTVGAFFLYRARRLESAGDVVSVRMMRPVFKYGVALCAGLALGIGTMAFIYGGETALIIAILVWGVIGYFAAQMLLDKSFKVFHKWKGAAATAAVFGVMFLVVCLDLTGFETRVPSPDSVESVHVSSISAVCLGDDGDWSGMELSDPELISMITILHQEAVNQRNPQSQTGGPSTGLNLTYTLKGGGTLTRRYTIWLDPSQTEEEGTAAWAIQQLYNNRELYWEVYGFSGLEQCLSGGGRLESVEHINYNDREGMHPEAYFYGQDGLALLAAVKEDFFAGRIGVRRLDDEEHWWHSGANEVLSFQATLKQDSEGYSRSWYIQIAVQDTSSSTLAALEELAGRAVLPDDMDKYYNYDEGYYAQKLP